MAKKTTKKAPKPPERTVSRPVSLDNLRIGMWLAVDKKKEQPKQKRNKTVTGGGIALMEISSSQGRDDFEATGIPFQLQGISLPFLVGYLVVSNNVVTIDTSRFNVVELTDNYVKVFLDIARSQQNGQATR